MPLCDHCLAELNRPEPLPPPWFDHDHHAVLAPAPRQIAPTPWRLLEILYRRRPRIVTKDSLMQLLYGYSHDPPNDHILCVYAHKLNRALAPTPYRLRAANGVGYFMDQAD